MIALKVAVLEDDKIFLTELVRGLKAIENINVVVYEQSSADFIEEVRKKQPDILLLDICLKDQPITGINVAELFNIPVLFLSSERKNFLDAIDNLKLKNKFPVEEIGKTFDADKLKEIFKLFIPRVKEFQKTISIMIKPKGEEEITIMTSDVSFIETIKTSGNHQLNFFSRKPIITADTTFEFFRNKGFAEDRFYKFGKSILFNISTTTYVNGLLTANFKNDKGIIEQFTQAVPEEKKKEVKLRFLK